MNWKMISALGAISLAAVATQANAADLAARPYTKAPPMIAAVYNWSGFYIGANGGYGTSHKCWDQTVGFSPATAEGCHDATGAVAGGQIGYRWQSNAFVFGLEAQGDWADLSGRNTSTVFGVANRTRVDAFGLFTGQVGYAWNNVLLYAKGGAAVTRDRYAGIGTGGLAGAEFDGAKETRWGGTVGVGFEYGFAQNWSVGLEYDHLFMGRHDVNLLATGLAAPAAGTFSRTERIGQDVDLITARINYRFGGPIIAKY
ncbi:outer membrane immunogenic protein [Bradyrhizobium sp. LB1.3]|uniref:outer membrane protein n=1 Tax=unclassified Bradyrhizobium TaxID=2631580 RepID=UPI001FFB6DBF|nr:MULTISPECIES: outer membrane beta-barrel protein [unclassified Bradyrhizobium]MCK1335236.1 porin family protein [Bradyrhizobium sp. 38]MCK1778737.1 porin family protein [Bradyrhizobium sp. 132]